MFRYRQVEFDNGATVFLRPQDHDRQIGLLLKKMTTENLVLDITVEKAAAWDYAVNLYHMPVMGSA